VEETGERSRGGFYSKESARGGNITSINEQRGSRRGGMKKKGKGGNFHFGNFRGESREVSFKPI